MDQALNRACSRLSKRFDSHAEVNKVFGKTSSGSGFRVIRGVSA